MPNQNILGQLFFVFLLLCLSTTTTTAQLSVEKLPFIPSAKEKGKKASRTTRVIGPRTKNPLAAGRQSRRVTAKAVVRQPLASPAYKNKRFRRTGKMSGNTAPRRKQLMGPAYKNRRFKRRRARVARFKMRT